MIEYVLYISLSLDASRMTNRSVWIVFSGNHRWHWLGSRDTNHETFSIIIARHGICHCTWFIMRDLCKSICRSYVGEIQNHLSKPEDLMLQNATSLRKSVPDLLTVYLWWACLLYCACHAKCIFPDPLRMSHACHRFWKCHKNLHFFSFLTMYRIPCTCHTRRPLNVQKWSETVSATAARTFSTSQLYFLHFDLETRFAPQHAFFRHFNFQKCSEHGVFCAFWLGNVLRATTSCNFSSPIWPAGPAPAPLASLLFDPLEPQISGKNTMFRDFPTFSRTCIFFLLTLSLLWSSLFCSSPLWLFPPLLLHLFILLEVWLLNFLRTYSNVIKRNIDSGFNFGSKRPIKNRIRVKIRNGTHQWL